MYSIVGLGNPGKMYKMTRHNVGRLFLERLQTTPPFSEWKKNAPRKALTSEGEIASEKVLLVLPETYMNYSGTSVKKLLEQSSLKELIILHDDLDLPLGSFKLSFGKSSGGNKGVSSIIDALGSHEFMRIRIGIAPTTLWGKIVKRTKTGGGFVISRFSSHEQKKLIAVEADVRHCLQDIISLGKDRAMNVWNSKK